MGRWAKEGKAILREHGMTLADLYQDKQPTRTDSESHDEWRIAVAQKLLDYHPLTENQRDFCTRMADETYVASDAQLDVLRKICVRYRIDGPSAQRP